MQEIQSLILRIQRLGQAVDWWNTAMIIALIIAALAAVAVVVTTRMALVKAKELTDAQGELDKAKDRELQDSLKAKDVDIGKVQLVADEAKERTAKVESDNLQLKTELERATAESRSKQAELEREQQKTAEIQKESAESQLALRQSMNRAFQRTGNRTLDPFAFHAALKGKPTGHVTVLANIDGGEPHQFAWQIWNALNRKGTGWSAEIKQLPPKPGWTGVVVRCRNPRDDNWLTEPKTACGALLNALLHGTEGFANVADAGSTLVAESDPSMPDNHFVVEVYPQPKPLAGNPGPSKQ